MDHSEHSHPHVNYFSIFIILCVCTAISVVFDLVHLPKSFLVFAVLAVAVAKASFVMTYFMHLKFEGNWKFIILMPTAILAIGLMIALAPDMAMHYYRNEGPQAKLHEKEVAAGLVDHTEDDHEDSHGSH